MFSETETKFKFGGSVERALRFHQGSETCTGSGLKPERVVGSGCPGKKVYSWGVHNENLFSRVRLSAQASTITPRWGSATSWIATEPLCVCTKYNKKLFPLLQKMKIKLTHRRRSRIIKRQWSKNNCSLLMHENFEGSSGLNPIRF